MTANLPSRLEDLPQFTHPRANLHRGFFLTWIRNPAAITGAHSSFTLSFEDPDGSVRRALLKLRLFVFGAPVVVKSWVERAPARPRPPLPAMDLSS
ncbi:hypothetical protein BDV93DRAFT_566446 [Ceratobasidium sp. AG-I]|nr:hypothetical protein BDV93DRAFT_566446 [Ceratobasidium sp. AG-I]